VNLNDEFVTRLLLIVGMPTEAEYIT